MKRGRLSKYTEAIAAEICARLAEGESLRAICSDPRMPEESRVREWAQNDRADSAGMGAGFAARYMRAREVGYEKMADEIIAISDADCTVDGQPDNALVQEARLRVDSRKWILSKMLPKKYGDRVTQELVGDPNTPLITRIELVPIASPSRPEVDDETAIGEAVVTPLRVLPSR